MRVRSTAAAFAIVLMLASAADSHAAAQPYNWLQFDGDPQHSGVNARETMLSAANVANLKPLFNVKLSDVSYGLSSAADGAPAYLTNVKLASGHTADMLFLTLRSGTLVALDAHSGAVLWSHDTAIIGCEINGGGQPCYTTSSPAVEPDGHYVYSYGLDGYVHKYAVGDGTEVTSSGWPELTSAKPLHEKGSAALSIATDKAGTVRLYVTHAGYPGDQGDYQGHLTTIDLATGTQRVFNAVCSDQAVHFLDTTTPDCPAKQTAIWARPGTVYDADTNQLYVTTGNGFFSPPDHDWGDSVLALNPDGTGVKGDPLDSYTPTEFSRLQITDADLGSAEPVVLPAAMPNSPYKHLAIQAGKDQTLRLLNLDNLSGSGKVGVVGGELALFSVSQGGQVLTMPVVWLNPTDKQTYLFIGNNKGLSALILRFDTSGKPVFNVLWQNSDPSTSPLLANGVLYAVGSNNLRAINPLTGGTLWQDTGIGGIHWQSPLVANGVLYVPDAEAVLWAYTLP